ncbi:hypothetical protein LCGC14_2521070 [marine sediment metagenome]|uniref:Uncharacterized protein n=1 Tax=marine sediment metagenome TaxID=412755 RepID=A0A0F9DPP0_9ZZZZ
MKDEPSLIINVDEPLTKVEQMFQTLDKLYDLSQAKEFYVYRWKWLK